MPADQQIRAGSRNLTAQNRWLLAGIAASCVIAADLLTKWWALSVLAPPPQGEGRVIDIVGSLRLRYAENTGMAFSKGAESGRWIALGVIVIVVVLLVVVSRASSKAQVVLLGVVIGGAIGNLLDRAFRAENGWLSGAVVDFIDLQWFPVFNVADSAVVVGGILLVLVTTREPTLPVDAVEPDQPGSGGAEE